MATPFDQVLSSDIYGSRLRLNPLSDQRSYATRLFRVRLDAEWQPGDTTPLDGAPWWDSVAAAPAADVDKFKRAIWAAVGTVPGSHPEATDLPVQDVTARQLGPYDFEVQADYLPDTRFANALQVSSSTIQIPVYREPFTSSSDSINPTSGLPSGNFIGRGDGVSVPANSGTIQSKLWVVPFANVRLRGEITRPTLAGLFGLGGAQNFVGFYNSTLYSIAGIAFAAGTLRYDGLSATSSTTSSDEETLVTYEFSWRPTGWWSQEISVDTSGLIATSDVNAAFPQTNFNSISFPT